MTHPRAKGSVWVMFAVLLGVVVTAASGVMGRRPIQPLLSAETASAIPDQYIVVLHESLPMDAIAQHQNWLSTLLALQSDVNPHPTVTPSNEIKHVYDMPEGGIKGYAGRFDRLVLEEIRKSEQVAYIEQDQVVHAYELQKDAPWGLSRISHRTRPTAEHYKEYPYPTTAGANVTAYVIDTGINIHHVDFEGRAVWGATIPQNDEDVDGNGHGTHCAGTIGGKRYGVAKSVQLVAIKVLASNGSGSMSDVIKGVEFAAQHHRKRTAKDAKARSVANMSLGGGASRTLDRAVNAAVDAGLHFAVAAGNDNRNACNYSPAAAEKAVTVGATALDDKMAWFSNHGKCVDVFAPGKDITSTWIGSNVATNTISGTSMASPHVAGLLAFLLSQEGVELTPKQLKALVISMSTKDVIKGLPKPKKGGDHDGDKKPKWPFPWPPPGGDDENEGKTPNRLIYTGYDGKKPKDGDDEPIEPVEPVDPIPTEPIEDDDDENTVDREAPRRRPRRGHHGGSSKMDLTIRVDVWSWITKTVRRMKPSQ